MIERWYGFRCNRCSEIIDFIEADSLEEASNIFRKKHPESIKSNTTWRSARRVICEQCLSKKPKSYSPEYYKRYYLEKVKPAREQQKLLKGKGEQHGN